MSAIQDSPTIDELENISNKYGFNCSNEELETYKDLSLGFLESFKYVENFTLPDNRSIYGENRPYYTLTSMENPYNAWYVKCNIEGNKTGKLHGKKVAIKDNTAVADIPMMNGSALIEGYIPEYDATVVQRILSNGGTIIGKTTCEDMCLSGASHLTKYGPVKNPKNILHTSGGSSSGSAVVVATGEADMAIGGDQGGSIRIPASCCGVVGLKPTHGLVPYTGAVPIVPSFDHLGPIARSVSDCALLLECIAGNDKQSDYRRHPMTENEDYLQKIKNYEATKRMIKVGILKEGVEICEDNVRKVFLKAVETLKANTSLHVEEISYPPYKNSIHVFTAAFTGNIYSSMIKGYANGSGTKGIQSHSLAKHLKKQMKDRASQCSPKFKMLTLLGEFINEKYGNYHICKANTMAVYITRDINHLLEDYDVIVMPTLVKTPPALPLKGASIKEIIEATGKLNLNTALFDYTGHPAISLNCGYHNDLPVGLQIVGKHFDESNLFTCASVFEETLKDLNSL